MGCGASTAAPAAVADGEPVKTTVTTTPAATVTTVSGGDAGDVVPNAPTEAPDDPEAEKAEREFMLEELFDACDDDGSGALSMQEFAQLLDNKVDGDTKALFATIDTDKADGKLTKEEFVAHHLQVFSALSYAQFQEMITPMLKKAEETDVIDETPAVVEDGDAEEAPAEPEPAAEEAPAEPEPAAEEAPAEPEPAAEEAPAEPAAEEEKPAE
jgi:hypothetical protein